MKRGKRTCKILKDIRRHIAEANGIEFVTSECKYKGDCLGTCPKCEAEVRYLEEELRRRSLSGKAVAIAGISASMLIMGSCGARPSESASASPQSETTEEIAEDNYVLQGEVPADIDTEDVINVAKPDGEGKKLTPEEEKSPKQTSPEEPQVISHLTGYEVIVREENAPVDSNRIYEVTDKKCQFPGGDKAFFKFINENLIYPAGVTTDKDIVTIIVHAVVLQNGKIDSPEVIRGYSPEFDSEALRVVQILPPYTPGYIDGQPVKSYITLPISFHKPKAAQ